jgi:hypothetical protein
MADIFNKPDYTMENPFTADACIVSIDGNPASYAVNVQVQYMQQVTRRRTIGGRNTAVIYGSMPNGQIQIQRLAIPAAMAVIGSSDTFKGCGQGGKVDITLAGNCGAGGTTFTCKGCIVSSYGLTIEAEGLTVMDNITIDFIQMSKG